MPYGNNIVHSSSEWDRSRSVKRYRGSKLFYTVTLSNINKRMLSLNQGSTLINPWFITGFIDAEGCFSVRVRKTTKTRIG